MSRCEVVAPWLVALVRAPALCYLFLGVRGASRSRRRTRLILAALPPPPPQRGRVLVYTDWRFGGVRGGLKTKAPRAAPEAVARRSCRTARWPLAAVAFVRPAVPDPSVAPVARPVAVRRRRCPCSWHALFRVKQGRSVAEPAQICRALPDRKQPCSCFRVRGQSSLARAPCHRFAFVRARPLLLPLPPFRPWPCSPLPFSLPSWLPLGPVAVAVPAPPCSSPMTAPGPRCHGSGARARGRE